MLLSAICCFFLFFGNSESAMIGWQCLFCGTSIAAWNALDVLTVELYPTTQRSVSTWPPRGSGPLCLPVTACPGGLSSPCLRSQSQAQTRHLFPLLEEKVHCGVSGGVAPWPVRKCHGVGGGPVDLCPQCAGAHRLGIHVAELKETGTGNSVGS